MNITKLIRTCPQFSSLTCQKVWIYMDVSNGIRTTDPHIISVHGFVDILELSFPALAVILSICPRTGNWVAVCIVCCSLSSRNDDRPVTFLQAISPTETVEHFSGAKNGFWKKTKNNCTYWILQSRLKQTSNKLGTIRTTLEFRYFCYFF
jgi:hypothetical protein